MLGSICLAILASQTNELVHIDRLSGEFVHAGGPEDHRAVEVAIDRVVEKMSWFARSIARRRLRSASAIPQRLRIVRAEDRVLIAFDGVERETRIGHPPLRVTGSSGDELEYTLELRRETLLQRFVGRRGGRLNELRTEGDRLVVRVTVFSPKLPTELVYELRYRRR